MAAADLPAAALAIVETTQQLTYRDLLQAACGFSDMLLTAGIQRGERVGVILGNRKEFLIAALGVWRCGAILLPLNPQFSQAELCGYLTESSVRVVITGTRKRSTIRGLRDRGVPIERAWLFDSDENEWVCDGGGDLDLSAATPVSPTFEIDSGSPAVTQYSTGSTGAPKRVTRLHGQLFGECRSVASLLHLTPDDRVLGISPFFHSYGLIVCALTTLLSGGTLYPVDGFLPDVVAALIERERLTALPGVPMMFKLLSELEGTYDFSSLRFALSAGAALDQAMARRFETLYAVPIRQLYGSTETGVIATSDVNEETAETTSVGSPIAGVAVELVDEAGAAVPCGQEGMVRVRSPFAPSGYDTQSESAGSCFREGAFFPGDVATLSASGQLTICGRRSGIINVNGLKVDPAEIEKVILRLPGVTEAVVLGVGAPQSGEKVKAVLVAADTVSGEAIRAHCARHLAPFKCPQIIEFRDALPRSSLGKILRKDLL
jgi:long-chain acyl-CoA synthetase